MVQAVVDRDVVTLVRVAPLPAVPDDLLKDAVPGVVEAAPVLEVAPNATGEHCFPRELQRSHPHPILCF